MINAKLIRISVQGLALSLLALGLAGQTYADVEVETMTVELRGTAPPVTRMIENLDGDLKEMACFDVGLFKPGTDKSLGTATDCLDFGTITPDPAGGPGFTLSNTTFFHFKGGTIVSQNRTAIQPVFGGSSAGSGTTHITGDVPDPTLNNVVDTTGKFSKVETGSVRLSGAVDLSAFPVITFSCIFVISLDMEDDDD